MFGGDRSAPSRKRPRRGNAAKAVDDYLAGVPAEMRAALRGLRATIKEVVPDAEEVISYQMPAFRLNGMLVCYAAFKDHCSLFAGAEIRRRFAEELKSFAGGKGTIQFTPDRPIPPSLVKRIVKIRVAENDARARARKRRR